MRRSITLTTHLLIVVALTLLTQFGGLVYLIALLVVRDRGGGIVTRRTRPIVITACAGLLYAVTNIWIAPILADQFGRIFVRCGATTMVACVLNRAYLRTTTMSVVNRLDRSMNIQFPHSHVTVLEGSFPFFDEFPLLPHLSHDDGRKVDLAYFYRGTNGQPIARGSPSPVGYFHFQQPHPGESAPCAGRFAPLRWDFAWLQPRRPTWILDEERTRAMILWLKAQPEVARIFVEPYLAERLGVAGGKVRFQGCWAARHDDHVHVEIR